MTPWLNIVGIGEDGLEALAPAARTLVATAEVLIGGERHLAMVPEGASERLTWRQPLSDTVADIEAHRDRRVTVLASGDPMSFGIGVTLARRYDENERLIVPAPGAFSLACARLGWPREEVRCLTLHGRPLALLNREVSPGARLLVMSEDGHTPTQVAAALRHLGYGPSRLVVLERMGGPRERRREGTAADWDEAPSADLNTIAVSCLPGPEARILSRAPGLPDDAFVHDGQLTKRIVRAATLAALTPLPGQLLWDLGAGCGSVAVEWLRAADHGRAHAVEREAGRCAMIAQNASLLGVPNLDIVNGDVDRVLDDLDPPDAIFVGGGITTAGLLARCWRALGPNGRLVANTVTVEGESALFEARRAHGGSLSRIAVSHAGPVGSFTGWRPAMPVTQWQVTKT
ncbi:MAG: precorrin-6y C5,15-methyltransferase (decarboxylating) subunit CbiE [Alphaproteobacteria bacterium]